jgi:anti-sigma regulatory factor (Ser/Thr protein kinase)
LELEAGMLQHMDPLPAIMRVLTDFEDLAEHRDSLFTILAELISNAIDHGLLGLHSSLKSTPEGFTEYYRRREQHLAEVHGGFLKVHIEHERQEMSGTIMIRVEDSGAGFDFTHIVPMLADNASYSGRGIELVRRLCRELRYLGNGNTAEAVYAWSSCSTDGSA